MTAASAENVQHMKSISAAAPLMQALKSKHKTRAAHALQNHNGALTMQVRSHVPQGTKPTLIQCQAKHIEVWVDVLTMRTNQERLSVRLMAAVIAKPASPAFTGTTTDTRMAVPNTTMLLMKSIRMASHLFMICSATSHLARTATVSNGSRHTLIRRTVLCTTVQAGQQC